jgi:ATP-dependent helicase Lhr and Lhr-like helicase
LSVVTSQPLFQVRYGRLEIGFVHPLSFAGSKKDPTILALGGRGWRLIHVDWSRKIAHVDPAQESGKSRWIGSSIPLSPALCASVRHILEGIDQDSAWSRRATDRLAELRDDLSPCCGDGTSIVRRGLSLEWWTFAGLAANQTIVQYLRPHIASPLRADNLWITLPSDLSSGSLNETLRKLRNMDGPPDWVLQQPAADLLKFGNLLPHHLLNELIMERIADIPRALEILRSPIRIVNEG